MPLATGIAAVRKIDFRFFFSLLQSVSVHTLYAYGGNEC
jgi:hypothetical protein